MKHSFYASAHVYVQNENAQMICHTRGKNNNKYYNALSQ